MGHFPHLILRMLRPHHPLFQEAESSSHGGGDTETLSMDSVQDVGDSPFGTPSDLAAPEFTPTAPAPAKPADAPFEAEVPVPEVLTPAPAPAPAPAAADPIAALSAALRASYPNESPGQIASRVATALAEPQEAEPEPEIDQEAVELENIGIRLEALRQQAREEGTSDYDTDIRALELDQVRIQARRDIRAELDENQSIDDFAREANQWDAEAGRAFPAADQPGHPLYAAVQARVAAVKASDPNFFIRSPDAGLSLVALEAAKLGIAPIAKPTGTAPSPHQPVPIAAPVALPGSVQGSHRPADGPAPDATQAWFQRMAAAEKSGSLAAQLDVARSFTESGSVHGGVAFAG